MELFPFQKAGVTQLLEGFEDHRVQCLAWYTGAGKTNVFIELCRVFLEMNPKAKIGISAFLTTEIKDQVTERLQAFGLGAVTETINSGSPVNLKKSIFVFNPQSIHRKPPEIEFDLLIVDESQSGMDEKCLMLPKIMKTVCSKQTKVLLVSATPWDTLALKQFEGIPVLKRPLDLGISDGLITDFKFHAEEAQITFTQSDFTDEGDLGRSAGQRQMAVFKSACIGKMEHIVAKYDEELGSKVLVICPPGNFCEVARTMALRFGGLAYIQVNKYGAVEKWIDTKNNLDKFKDNPQVRFLFVTNKCQVGFDMQDLTSVVDLTMTRNIKVLAQRCGRIARKAGRKQKHYFHVYDQSMMKDQLEWLIVNMIDFCLGAYDGWTTRSAKYRKPRVVSAWSLKEPFATTLSEVVEALRSPDMIQNMRTLAYIAASGPPSRWTLARALEEAEKWSSRTEMWSKQPALYKWFRLNAKQEMDRIFPLKHHMGKWNEETVIAAMKKCSGRQQFCRTYTGANWWVRTHRREDLKDKYLPASKSARIWNEETVKAALRTVRKWSDIRTIGNLRRWMHKRGGGEYKWKRVWMQMTPGERLIGSNPRGDHGRPQKMRGTLRTRALARKRDQEAS